MTSMWTATAEYFGQAGLAGRMALGAFVLPGLAVILLRWKVGHRFGLQGFVRSAVMLPLVLGLTGWLWEKAALAAGGSGAFDLRTGGMASLVLALAAAIAGMRARRRASEGLPFGGEAAHSGATTSGST